jgi:hypothetical protein
VKILQADPTTSAGDILGPGVVKANPFLANMTAADLQAWAARRVGGQPSQARAVPPQAALVAPQQPAPIFAQPPTPQQPQQQASDVAPYMPAATPQMQPIFAAQRPRVDLTKLRAAFQPPQFYRG